VPGQRKKEALPQLAALANHSPPSSPKLPSGQQYRSEANRNASAPSVGFAPCVSLARGEAQSLASGGGRWKPWSAASRSHTQSGQPEPVKLSPSPPHTNSTEMVQRAGQGS
jgi:hypothetical protein